MLTIVIHIFQRLLSSMFVSDIYGLMWCIFYPIFVAPYCNVTIPLFQHFLISDRHLYGVWYLKQHYYWVCIYLWLYSGGLPFHYFLRMLSLLICSCFQWCINSQSTICFMGIIALRHNTNFPGIRTFNLFYVE